MRDNAIDALRGVAVLLVFFYHVKLLPAGFVGVDIFFTLSGFLITRSILRKYPVLDFGAIVDFYANRIVRLFPVLLVAFSGIGLCSFVLISDASRYEVLKNGLFALANLANVYSIVHDGYFGVAGEFNPFSHFWSLSIEEQFYLVIVPLLAVIVRRRSPFWWLISAGILIFLIPVYYVGVAGVSPDRLYLDSLSRFWQLYCGVSYAFIKHTAPEVAVAKTVSPCRLLWIALVVFGLLSVFGFGPQEGLIWLAQSVLVALGTLLFMELALNCKASFPSTPLERIGVISYGFYVYHYPAIVFYRWSVGVIGGADIVAILAFVLALSHFSYQWMEVKALTWKLRSSRIGAEIQAV